MSIKNKDNLKAEEFFNHYMKPYKDEDYLERLESERRVAGFLSNKMIIRKPKMIKDAWAMYWFEVKTYAEGEEEVQKHLHKYGRI